MDSKNLKDSQEVGFLSKFVTSQLLYSQSRINVMGKETINSGLDLEVISYPRLCILREMLTLCRTNKWLCYIRNYLGKRESGISGESIAVTVYIVNQAIVDFHHETAKIILLKRLLKEYSQDRRGELSYSMPIPHKQKDEEDEARWCVKGKVTATLSIKYVNCSFRGKMDYSFYSKYYNFKLCNFLNFDCNLADFDWFSRADNKENKIATLTIHLAGLSNNESSRIILEAVNRLETKGTHVTSRIEVIELDRGANCSEEIW